MEIAHIDTVDQHGTRRRVEEPGYQAEQGGLARAGTADDRCHLPGLGEQGDIGQHRCFGTGVVESDIA